MNAHFTFFPSLYSWIPRATKLRAHLYFGEQQQQQNKTEFVARTLKRIRGQRTTMLVFNNSLILSPKEPN